MGEKYFTVFYHWGTALGKYGGWSRYMYVVTLEMHKICKCKIFLNFLWVRLQWPRRCL